MKHITDKTIFSFRGYLTDEEKSAATVEKYIRDVTAFKRWLSGKEFDKRSVLEYKEYLRENYKVTSVNSVISSLNKFFEFCGLYKVRIKTIKVQKQIFLSKDKELTKSEYERLLKEARNRGNERINLVMQTICSTGIRVSELKFITVDAVKNKVAHIYCKSKMRTVFLPDSLCKMLAKYIRVRKIEDGAVFVTKAGIPLNRSNIWSDMKKLCERAGVAKEKVFPHNLRHLFARTYYSVQKDIVRLADILGHSSINTTRIYTMETGEIHRRQIQKLGLLRC